MTKWNIVPVALVAGLFMAAPAQAQVAFGPQVSFGTESDLGVGARADRWTVAPSTSTTRSTGRCKSRRSGRFPAAVGSR